MLDGAQIIDPGNAIRFALSGNARMTLVSRKTGARFTYRIRSADQFRTRTGEIPRAGGVTHFVSVLTGPDNAKDYVYLGYLVGGGRRYVHGVKSRIDATAPSAHAFGWAWMRLMDEQVPADLEVWHEGRCGKCGRALTTPESIASGIGPVCAGVL
jgi:hypothetical protein